MPTPVSVPAGMLGERIRERRNALGISQETLAERSGHHWTFVGQVERGQRNLSFHNLLKLAAGLDLDAGALVRGLQPPVVDLALARCEVGR
jgi:transcriptional regulator with XRE-family HTH domain